MKTPSDTNDVWNARKGVVEPRGTNTTIRDQSGFSLNLPKQAIADLERTSTRTPFTVEVMNTSVIYREPQERTKPQVHQSIIDFFQPLAKQMQELAKAPGIDPVVADQIRRGEYGENHQWFDHVMNLHTQGNLELVATPLLERFGGVEKGISARAHTLNQNDVKNISVKITDKGLTSRYMVGMVINSMDADPQYVVATVERTIPLSALFKSPDAITEADLAGSKEVVKFSEVFSEEAPFLQAFEKVVAQDKQESVKANEARSKAKGAWTKLNKEMPTLVQQLEAPKAELVAKATELTKTPLKSFENTIKRYGQFSMSESGKPALRPRLLLDTNDERIKTQWVQKAEADMSSFLNTDRATEATNTENQQWLEPLKRLASVDTGQVVLTPIDTILKGRVFNLSKGQLDVVIDREQNPPVKFTVHRDKEGRITSVDFMVEGTYNLVNKTTGSVVVSPLVKGFVKGTLIRAKDGTFVIPEDSVKIHYDSPYRSASLTQQNVQPLATPTTGTPAKAALAMASAAAGPALESKRGQAGGGATEALPKRVTTAAPASAGAVAAVQQSTPSPMFPVAAELVGAELDKLLNAKQQATLDVAREDFTPHPQALLLDNIKSMLKDNNGKPTVIDVEGRKIAVPHSVFADIARNIGNSKVTVYVKIGSTVVNLPRHRSKRPFESESAYIIAKDKALNKMFARYYLAIVKALGPSSNPEAVFNVMMFIHTQSGYKSEAESLMISTHIKQGETEKRTFMSGRQLDDPRATKIIIANGQMTSISSGIFEMQGTNPQRYLVNTMHRKIPLAVLETSPAKLKLEDLNETREYTHDSIFFTSLKDAREEFEKRTKGDYGINNKEVEEIRNAKNEAVQYWHTGIQTQIENFERDRLTETNLTEQVELSFKAYDGTYTPNFKADFERDSSAFTIMDGPKKTSSARRNPEVSRKRLTDALGPGDQNQKWNLAIQAVVGQTIPNWLLGSVKTVVSQHAPSPELFFIRINEPSVELTLNRSATGQIQSVTVRAKGTMDLRMNTRFSNSIEITPAIMTASFTGTLQMDDDDKPILEIPPDGIKRTMSS
ncbi:MAG: hypothetical protein H0X51_09770 [Parachlamydiaceae bacterium]|nr:hypothetical protein [Parachlamydiaceae bacterium]